MKTGNIYNKSEIRELASNVIRDRAMFLVDALESDGNFNGQNLVVLLEVFAEELGVIVDD